ncbi:hypothetical protein [Leucothrix mucor]|uniref:hypothetical protein n=1 Tax=Leucothrix mucor TaxID=45248 RepID=UPI0003B765AA|nr:hypothetical protein [Leucothrix mucor]
MDFSSITAAYEGLKTGKAILQSIYDMKIEAETKERVDEVMSKLGEAQDTLFVMREELFRLQTKNAELMTSISQADDWEKRISQYLLAETSGGAVVYKYSGTPEHYACPSCAGKRVIEILQDNRTASGKFRCVGCDAQFPINPKRAIPAGRIGRA